MPEPQNTYDTVHRAITDVVSRPQDNIALVYGNSNRDTYSALVFQVTRTVRRVERVEGVLTNFADQATAEFGYVGENGFSQNVSSPGDDVFRIETERNSTLVEYGVAVQQDGVYAAVQPANESAVNGLREGADRNRGFSADDLPTRGGVLSDHTYVDAPSTTLDFPVPTTALSEQPTQGVVRMDSEENGVNNFYFAFNNQSGGQIDVDITAIGQTYEVRPIMDEQIAKDILAGDGFRRRILNWGGFGNTRPNLPKPWVDARVTVGPGDLMPA